MLPPRPLAGNVSEVVVLPYHRLVRVRPPRTTTECEIQHSSVLKSQISMRLRKNVVLGGFFL